MTSASSAIKGAEVASAIGAIVLGAGLALLAPQVLQGHALLIVFTGLVVHGAGMTLKYRLESRDGPPLWWERAMFWLCWACLAGLGGWLLVRGISR